MRDHLDPGYRISRSGLASCRGSISGATGGHGFDRVLMSSRGVRAQFQWYTSVVSAPQSPAYPLASYLLPQSRQPHQSSGPRGDFLSRQEAKGPPCCEAAASCPARSGTIRLAPTLTASESARDIPFRRQGRPSYKTWPQVWWRTIDRNKAGWHCEQCKDLLGLSSFDVKRKDQSARTTKGRQVSRSPRPCSLASH